MATCNELSEDREVVNQIVQHYWANENLAATPVTSLFPWFPSFAKKAKQKAIRVLYDIFLSYVNIRRESSTLSMDPIDFFISQGISDDAIVGDLV